MPRCNSCGWRVMGFERRCGRCGAFLDLGDTEGEDGDIGGGAGDLGEASADAGEQEIGDRDAGEQRSADRRFGALDDDSEPVVDVYYVDGASAKLRVVSPSDSDYIDVVVEDEVVHIFRNPEIGEVARVAGLDEGRLEIKKRTTRRSLSPLSRFSQLKQLLE